MQYRIVGKPRFYEMVGESSQSMLVRFLIHFLFVEHDHKMINLFEENDPVFKVFKKKPQNLLEKNVKQMNDAISKLSKQKIGYGTNPSLGPSTFQYRVGTDFQMGSVASSKALSQISGRNLSPISPRPLQDP